MSFLNTLLRPKPVREAWATGRGMEEGEGEQKPLKTRPSPCSQGNATQTAQQAGTVSAMGRLINANAAQSPEPWVYRRVLASVLASLADNRLTAMGLLSRFGVSQARSSEQAHGRGIHRNFIPLLPTGSAGQCLPAAVTHHYAFITRSQRPWP